jgi:O-antigen biosynthesis protein
MSLNPLVEISVAIKNNWSTTEKFLKNLLETTSTYDNVAINVIDNSSKDITVNELEKFKNKITIFYNDSNKGFAFAHNMILKKSQAVFNCILHNDIILPENWLNSMVNNMINNPKIAILGVVNNCNGDFSYGMTLENNGLTTIIDTNDTLDKNKLDVIHSSCMLIRNRICKNIGYFDEKFLFGIFSDIDFCIRAKDLGFELDISKDLIIDHYLGMTIKSENLENYKEQNRIYLLNKNKNWFIENKGSIEIRKKINRRK